MKIRDNSVLASRPELAAEVGKVAEVAGYLWEKGWAERNGGNITVNITEYVDDGLASMPAVGDPVETGADVPLLKGNYFYCKGNNRRMRDLAEDPMANGSVIRVTEDGLHYEIVADAAVKPTSELPSHLSVHNWFKAKGLPYKASLHTHPIELVAMSHHSGFLGKDVLTYLLWSMIPETKAFCPRGLGIVPYRLPGSLRLAQETMKELEDYDVVMWEKHGVFAVDEDIIKAFDQVDVLNKAAQIYMSARSMGFEPEGMTRSQMAEISEVFHLPK